MTTTETQTAPAHGVTLTQVPHGWGEVIRGGQRPSDHSESLIWLKTSSLTGLAG